MITMKMRLFIKLSVFRLFFSYCSQHTEREGEGHILHPTYIYMSSPSAVVQPYTITAVGRRNICTGIVTLVPMQLLANLIQIGS